MFREKKYGEREGVMGRWKKAIIIVNEEKNQISPLSLSLFRNLMEIVHMLVALFLLYAFKSRSVCFLLIC